MALPLFRTTAFCGLLAAAIPAFDQAASTAFLKASQSTGENGKLLRMEALAEADSVFAAGAAPSLEEITGTRLEALSRKLLIKKSLGLNFGPELYLMDLWYQKRQGFDSLYRTNPRDLAHYALAMSGLGRNTDAVLNELARAQRADGSWSEKAGKEGSAGLTALAVLALKKAAAASAYEAWARRGVQWLSPGLTTRLTANRIDLLFLLRTAALVHADPAFQAQFEALWKHVERQQLPNGSIQGDIELTAMASLIHDQLPNNVVLKGLSLVNAVGRLQSACLEGQPMLVSMRFGARLADYSGGLKIRAELQSNSTGSATVKDTVFTATMVKGAEQDFTLSLGNAGSPGTYRLSGEFSYLSGSDSVKTPIQAFFIRVDEPSDLRFTGDSLRILPDSASPGDTVAIRVRFVNAGKTIVDPFKVICLVKPAGGGYDTLGLQEIGRASSGTALDFSFLSSFPAGDFEARLILDAEADIDESDENNNVADRGFSMVAFPDLAFKGGVEVSCLPSGDSALCQANATLINVGSAASDSFSLRTSVFAGLSAVNFQDSLFAGLAVDGEVPVTIGFSLPDSLSLTHSSYLIVLTLDHAGAIKEREEGNNRAEKQLNYSAGENLLVRESMEEPSPIFIVPGYSVQEHFNVLAQSLEDSTAVAIRFVVLRDSLDTLVRRDTTLNFGPGQSAKPLSFSWMPVDSAYRYQVNVIVDPDSSLTEAFENDNSLYIRRYLTGYHPRLLAGPALVDSAGELTLKVLAKDYLGKAIPGLDKGQFALSNQGVKTQAFEVVPRSNPQSEKNRIDIVIMDTHEPAFLYRTRKVYYDLMPELQHEFAMNGFSLHYTFRTPYFKERTSNPAIRGDLPQGIFNGEVRNLLDEPDHTYKWAPPATYLATYHPWRENALKVIVPMFDFLGQGEEINPGDPIVPNIDDSSAYHIEFADTCANRGVNTFLLVNNWGYSELLDAQVKGIVSITGGARYFPGTKDRMKAELRQFIVERLANYEIQGDTRTLGLNLSEADRLVVELDHLKGKTSDTALVSMPKDLALDVQLALTDSEVSGDSLHARLILRNLSHVFLPSVDLDIRKLKNGQALSRFIVSQGSLGGMSQKSVEVSLPLTADSSLYVFKAMGDFRDVAPANNSDSLLQPCPRCPYPDLSIPSDTLAGFQVRQTDVFRAQFVFRWHDNTGGQAEIAVSGADGAVLYRGEITSQIGFNQTQIDLTHPTSLAGEDFSIRISYLDRTDRNPLDNSAGFRMKGLGGPLSAFFQAPPALVRMNAEMSGEVEFASEFAQPVDTLITIAARNLSDGNLVTVLRPATSTEVEPSSEGGREFFLDLSIVDSLSGVRYGQYHFNESSMAASLRLPQGSVVNASSFKVVKMTGAGAGSSYPLFVKPQRTGNDITGYLIQWGLQGARDSSAASHRLYFSYKTEKSFSDVDYVGEEVYTLNNLGSLYRMQAFNGEPSSPVFLQQFPGGDSLRFMRMGVGDINEDGYNDIIYGDKHLLLARLGSSTGAFGDPDTLKSFWMKQVWVFDYFGVAEPKLGDFNGDGHLDIAVSAIGVTNFEILLGDGTGNFTLGNWGPGWVGFGAPGDVFRPVGFNKDLAALSTGAIDVWGWPEGWFTVQFAEGGNWTYVGYGYTGLTTVPQNGLTVADFDNDGKEDMISDFVYSSWSPDPGNTLDNFTNRLEVPPSIAYWKGTGAGHFTPKLGIAEENKVAGFIPSVSNWSEVGSMDNLDFNGDGFEDLILTESSSPYRTMAYAGRGDYTFDAPVVLGYDSVGVWGMQVAYRRLVRTTAGSPQVNRPLGNVLNFTWDPADLGPGDYSLEAWVKHSSSDSDRIGLSAPFRILPALEVDVSVEPDQAVFAVGRDFSGSVALENTSMVHTASELSLRIIARAPGDTSEVYFRSGFSVGPDSRIEIPIRFGTHASQSLLMIVEQAGEADSTVYSIPVTANQAMVKGSIDLGDYNSVGIFRTGRSLSFHLDANNAGNGPLTTRLLLLLENLSTFASDTLYDTSITIASDSGLAATAVHTLSGAGNYRAILLRQGPLETVALDTRLIRVTESQAPQIASILPAAGSVVSAGSLVDIWIDTLNASTQVSTIQHDLNRTAVFRKDSLGYRIFQDTIQSHSGSQLQMAFSAQDGLGNNAATSLDDANPASLTYLYSDSAQPFLISGVQDGGLYVTDRLIAVRADGNLIRFPAVILDGQSWNGGMVAAEGNHEILLTGILTDSRAYQRTIRFSIDKTGPVIESDNLQDGDLVDHEVTPIVRAFDPHGVILSVFLDGRVWDGASVGPGSHVLLASARDSLGNESTASFAFTVAVRSGKYARINPPADASHHNRTVFPDLESNLEDIVELRIGKRNPAAFDSAAWPGMGDTLRTDSVIDWASAFTRGDVWSKVADTTFTGFGPNGHYFSHGIQTDSLASWASESAGQFRGGDPAFPESLLVASTDSGLFLFDSHTGNFWMKFNISYPQGTAIPIHRPLYNLHFQDGYLSGFWDSSFVLVSFVKDAIFSWNKNTPYRYIHSWKKVSQRNGGTNPTNLYLGWYESQQPGFKEMHQAQTQVRSFKGYQIAEITSPDGYFSVEFNGGTTPSVRANPNSTLEARGISNGKGYRFRPYNDPNHSYYLKTMMDTLGKYVGIVQDWSVQESYAPEYQYLAPDVDLRTLLKSFGNSHQSAPVRSMSFLSPDQLQTTYFNYLDGNASSPKRVLKVGKQGALLINPAGAFNSEAWTVEKGAATLRNGLVFTDTSVADTAKVRLRILEKKGRTTDFIADYTFQDTKPSRNNAYIRVALLDTQSVERAAFYVKCVAVTSIWYGSTFTVQPKAVTTGYQVGSQSEQTRKIETLPIGATMTYQLRMVRKNGVYILYFWDIDKWSAFPMTAGGALWKGPMRMEFSVKADSGNPAIGFRLDRYQDMNTYYLPDEVASLTDARNFGDHLLLRVMRKDGQVGHLLFDTASKAFENMFAPFAESGERKILALGKGKILTRVGSQFSVRSNLNADPISPLDSVSEEGAHELLARVVSQRYGTFRDTSRFTIDRTRPVVTIDSIAPGQVYQTSRNIQYSITDLHLDSTRTEVTLNGLVHPDTLIALHGNYVFRIKAVDSAGNVTDTSVAFALAPLLRPTGILQQLIMNEDVADSSVNVGAMFTPSTGLTYAVLPAAGLGLGITASKSLFVQPASNFSGIRDVILQATLEGVSVLDTLRVTVRPVNDAPVLLSNDSITGTGGQAVVYQVLFEDVEDHATFEVQGLPNWLTVLGDTLSGTAPLGGADTTFILTLSDGDTSVNQTIHVVIQNANLPPVIGPVVEAEPKASGQAISLDLTAHESDPNPGHPASVLTWSWSSSANVTVTPGANNNLWTLTPASGFADTVSLRLTLTDPLGAFTYQDVLLDWSLDNGPVRTYLKHWFPFREGTGTESEDSLTAHDFLLPSASMWSLDTGLTFRTVTTPAVADTTVLNPLRGLSLEFWLKSDSLTTTTLDLVRFTHVSPADAPAIAVRLNNHELRVLQGDGADSTVAAFPGALVSENLWHHFVASLDADSVALYRNGILFGKAGHPALNTSPMTVIPSLGGAATVGGNPAGIALLRVYERKFSAFKATHNYAKAEKQEGLAAVVEGEAFTRRVGSHFPFKELLALPSDTALGMEDTTVEECLLMPADSSFLEFTVNVADSGDYSLLGRALGKVKDNSFWVQMDDTDPVIWHTDFQNRWKTEWVRGPIQSLPDQWTLTAGSHTVRIYTREMGTYLDWFGLAKSDDLVLPFVENPTHFTAP